MITGEEWLTHVYVHNSHNELQGEGNAMRIFQEGSKCVICFLCVFLLREKNMMIFSCQGKGHASSSQIELARSSGKVDGGISSENISLLGTAVGQEGKAAIWE